MYTLYLYVFIKNDYLLIKYLLKCYFGLVVYDFKAFFHVKIHVLGQK